MLDFYFKGLMTNKFVLCFKDLYAKPLNVSIKEIICLNYLTFIGVIINFCYKILKNYHS